MKARWWVALYSLIGLLGATSAWAIDPVLYSDNTTVRLANPEQNVTSVGVRYVYKWQ